MRIEGVFTSEHVAGGELLGVSDTIGAGADSGPLRARLEVWQPVASRSAPITAAAVDVKRVTDQVLGFMLF